MENTALSFLDRGAVLCSGTASVQALTFPLDDPNATGDSVSTDVHPGAPAPVTALETLLGGQTLVAGDAKGRVTGLLRVRTNAAEEARLLHAVKEFEPQGAAITAIAGSPRSKTFVTGDADGVLVARFGTNARTLVKTRAAGAISAIGIAPKADGYVAVTPKGVVDFSLEAPHPEISLGALFGKVLYEGYDKPEYVWQSSGGTDDFEPKLSLVPLVFGTLKGTFYAMLFAIPIALAAALYTSAFATPRIKRFVKPIVEIMAALPSVVLGFLAGLWLAPLLQKATLSALLLVPMIPLFACSAFWRSRCFRSTCGSASIRARALLIPARSSRGGVCALMGPGSRRSSRGRLRRGPRVGLPQVRRAQLARHRVRDGLRGDPDHLTISEDALSSVPST